MNLKVWELISIFLAALVTGVFWGPWLGLSRSIRTFKPEVFLAIGHRMIGNLAPSMPFLMPAAMLSILPVLVIAHHGRPQTFYVTLAGFVLFIFALLVTLIVEVPIDNQIKRWTATSLPDNWEHLRDRWPAEYLGRTANAEEPDSQTRSRNGKEIESELTIVWERFQATDKGMNWWAADRRKRPRHVEWRAQSVRNDVE